MGEIVRRTSYQILTSGLEKEEATATLRDVASQAVVNAGAAQAVADAAAIADLSNVPAGSVTRALLAADAVQTGDYAEDGSGNATTGVKMFAGASGTTAPLRIAPGGAKVGQYSLDEPVVASLRAIAREDTDVNKVWYRGNGNPGYQGGAPRLVDPLWASNTAYVVGDLVRGGPASTFSNPTDTAGTYATNPARYVYRCTQAGTSSSSLGGPNGTGTSISDGGCLWDYVAAASWSERLSISEPCGYVPNTFWLLGFKLTINPRSFKHDNLDALRYMKVQIYNSTSTSTLAATSYVNLADRLYANTDDTNAANACILPMTLTGQSMASVFSGFGTPDYGLNGYLRVTVYNASGPSATRDFSFIVGSGVPGVPGSWSLGGSAGSSGGGGGGGGGCLDPATPVLVSEGQVVPLGKLRAGDMVWTQPEGGGAPGLHRIERATQTTNLRVRVTLKDGRSFISSTNHLLCVRGLWRRADSLMPGEELDGRPSGWVASVEYLGEGPVVQLYIPTAGTYFGGDGAWHHNSPIQKF